MALNEYNSMASYYDFVLEPIFRGVRKRIVEISRVTPGMKILEVACGTGAQGERFRKAGALYTGVDLSPAMLAVAEKRNLGCLLADGTKLPLENNTFDLSTITLALHEVEPETSRKLVNEMIRVTKKDGFLIIVDYTLSGKRSLYSNIGKKSVHYIEKLVGGSHYTNYLKFMDSGGLLTFLEQFNIEVLEKIPVFGGNIGIFRTGLQ